MTPGSEVDDIAIRQAAFEHVRRLSEIHDHLTTQHLRDGFVFRGERIPLINPQRGIFKPARMHRLLSIRTVFPSPGRGRYRAFVPTFVVGWDAGALKARIAFGIPEQSIDRAPESAVERRYALRSVKQRLHQASFREAVITAYGGRCALSKLPEPLLLDAAHIIADKDEVLGQPVVPTAFRYPRFTMQRSMLISSGSTPIIGFTWLRDCSRSTMGRCWKPSNASMAARYGCRRVIRTSRTSIGWQ